MGQVGVRFVLLSTRASLASSSRGWMKAPCLRIGSFSSKNHPWHSSWFLLPAALPLELPREELVHLHPVVSAEKFTCDRATG